MGSYYDSIRERFDVRNHHERVFFDTVIVDVIHKYCQAQNRTCISQARPNSSLGPSIVAEEGIDELPGPTVIVIVHDMRSSLMLKRISRHALSEADLWDQEIASILLVLTSELSPKSQTIARNRVSRNTMLPVGIWDQDKLAEVFESNVPTIQILMDNIATTHFRRVIESENSDWKSDQEESVKQVAKLYAKGEVALFLGAGTSVDAGIPSWNRLLESLFVKYLTQRFATDANVSDDEIAIIVEKLRSADDPSPLMTARYLRHGITQFESEEKENFQKEITSELYKQIGKAPPRFDLLKVLALMTRPRRSGAKVVAVVTYNFDDLLEKELTNTGDQFHSIFREGDIADPDELPIYHVHGFLPENRDEYDGLDEATLAFSEEGYHKIYSDSYHWSNLVQLNLLREASCLFIGLSLTDPNLRRLLEISVRRTTKRRHFALMRRMSVKEFIGKRRVRDEELRETSVMKFLE